jgi:hypothetical protein
LGEGFGERRKILKAPPSWGRGWGEEVDIESPSLLGEGFGER